MDTGGCRMGQFSFYLLVPRHTPAYSLLANAALCCRFGPPLAFNFMAAIALPPSSAHSWRVQRPLQPTPPHPVTSPACASARHPFLASASQRPALARGRMESFTGHADFGGHFPELDAACASFLPAASQRSDQQGVPSAKRTL